MKMTVAGRMCSLLSSLPGKDPQIRDSYYLHHRRRINIEDKAKVIATVWWAEFIQFLAVLAILHKTILKNRMNSSLHSNRPGVIYPSIQIVQCKTASAARNWINSAPQCRSNYLCLFFCLYPSSMTSTIRQPIASVIQALFNDCVYVL